ncbi:hypothetical protein GJ698_10540 [Pseudoduganella sp. FT26W]|uniref:Uncharacterized protein n=1 Tax=Duganella aquatilis TaxID=2666082 RepID=A0A844CVY0_9BURK|nr:hypothetical protein [Duganella aquatilis]MRW84523.1 hypothetical protein [Duganella aquatilis]
MMQAVEKWLARVLLLNSGLALAVSFGLLGTAQQEGSALLYGAALLGFLSGLLSLRRARAGLWGGILYYMVQLLSYVPHDGGAAFGIKAGISLGMVMQFKTATVVVNMFALALLAATVAVLWRRRRQPSSAP